MRLLPSTCICAYIYIYIYIYIFLICEFEEERQRDQQCGGTMVIDDVPQGLRWRHLQTL